MLGIERRHLSQSILLEETGNPLVIRAVAIFVFLLVAVFACWASVARVDEVAVATGEIQPVLKVQQVQSFDGGLVAEILVKDGDAVEKGRTVLRLDTFDMRSELREAQSLRESLAAQQARLQTLLEKQTPGRIAANRGNAAPIAPSNVDDGRLAFANPLVQELTDRGKRLSAKRQAILKELDMNGSLLQKQHVPLISVLALRRDLGEVEADIAEINEKLVTEYTRIGNEQVKVQEQIERLEDKLRKADIRAPAAGIVHGLKAHTVGGMIAKGDAVMEIVPADSPLEAVVKIVPRDVGHVRVGQPVKLRFTAYDFSRYGVGRGVLRDISATAFLEKDGITPYHQGWVTLKKNYVGPAAARNLVLPGMTMQADIVTGSKTVLEYLLKPIYASAKQVFRER